MSTTARVEITLDLPAEASWSDECPCSQVFKAAGEETVNGLRNILYQKYGQRARFVGEPKVILVMHAKDK